MKKKVSISILVFVGLLLVVGSLYGTFAYNSTLTSNSDSYIVTLSGSSEKVTVPAKSNKTVIYKVTNTNKGSVQYGLAYQGSNIKVYYYEDTEDMPSGLIDYGQNKFIKLYIENTSSSSNTVTIKPILGYRYGGSLITPSGYTLVTDLHFANAGTPYIDFEYYLGDEYPTVTQLKFRDVCFDYGDGGDTCLDYSSETMEEIIPITLNENEILLTKYIGESSNVIVPDTYNINGKKYNVILLSVYKSAYTYVLPGFDIISDGVFYDNDLIEEVEIGENVKFLGLDSSSLGYGDSIYKYNTMNYLFYSCGNLKKISVVLNGITEMSYTFSGCINLANFPDLPESVINLDDTFVSCWNLVTAPKIPDGVISLNYTFFNCKNLVTAPEIPSSVTDMYATFRNCTNLTGTIRINSDKVSSIGEIFTDTVLPIIVEVPASSATYTKFSNANLPSNVTLKTFDDGSSKTVNLNVNLNGDSIYNKSVILSSSNNFIGKVGTPPPLTGTPTADPEAGFILNGLDVEVLSAECTNEASIVTYNVSNPSNGGLSFHGYNFYVDNITNDTACDIISGVRSKNLKIYLNGVLQIDTSITGSTNTYNTSFKSEKNYRITSSDCSNGAKITASLKGNCFDAVVSSNRYTAVIQQCQIDVKITNINDDSECYITTSKGGLVVS